MEEKNQNESKSPETSRFAFLFFTALLRFSSEVRVNR